jgi:phosphatidylserine/phosphatidylglycerophosphate/cardiolipin synthase-like enzyme/DNA/RNA endonuclease YhcR with UshA esterase domain
MFSRFFFLFLLTQTFLTNAQVQTISNARSMPVGSTITVRGIVTNGAELGKIRYFQDGTGGIAAFPNAASAPNFEANVMLGDSIEVTGTLVSFHELLEITPITNYTVISSQNPIPVAVPVTFTNLSDDFESELVEVDCVIFDEVVSSFSTQGTYNITDANGQISQVYIRNVSPFFGTTTPTQSVKITGILSQYDNKYQFLPRLLPDISTQSCFNYSINPQQTNIETTSFTVNWDLNKAAASVLKYGTSFPLSNESISSNNSTSHEVDLTGLEPGTIYYVQAQSTLNGETILSEIVTMATKSTSSGEIKVYFTKSVDTSIGGGSIFPNGQTTQVVENEIIARINAAVSTIDVAIYNNIRFNLNNALKAAHNRGVRVRYIGSLEAQVTPITPTPPFQVLLGNDVALMHNKFMVIDAEDAQKCWVMGGSMNWTPGNMDIDFNNVLFIQDQSLARTYTIEFEEMWGSNTATFNTSNAKFGSAKTDNTPHQFIIGNVPVECYFSPSDKVTSRIQKTIESADNDLQFALLTMTKNELGDAIIARKNAGVSCRGIIENFDDIGSEFNYMQTNGVNVVADAHSEQLHHKYMVVDALLQNSDPTVWTGSHNWTFTAETSNDENSLVIHDKDIAIMYLQEFQKRWTELFPISTSDIVDNQLFKLFPNPANDEILILSNQEIFEEMNVLVFDINGKEVFQKQFEGTNKVLIPLQNLSAGAYFVKIIQNKVVSCLSFQKI